MSNVQSAMCRVQLNRRQERGNETEVGEMPGMSLKNVKQRMKNKNGAALFAFCLLLILSAIVSGNCGLTACVEVLALEAEQTEEAAAETGTERHELRLTSRLRRVFSEAHVPGKNRLYVFSPSEAKTLRG